MFNKRNPTNTIFVVSERKRNSMDAKPNAIPTNTIFSEQKHGNVQRYDSVDAKPNTVDDSSERLGYRGDAWHTVKEQQETIKYLEKENVELKTTIDSFKEKICKERDALMLLLFLACCFLMGYCLYLTFS